MSKDFGVREFAAGDAVKLTLTVVDEDVQGEPPLDVSIYQTSNGGTLTLTLSEAIQSDLGILALDEAGGAVTFPDAPNGLIEIEITSADTVQLPAGDYHVQVRGVDGAAQASRLSTGRFDVATFIKAPS